VTCGETTGKKSFAYIFELSDRRPSKAVVSPYPSHVSPSRLSSTFPSPRYRWHDPYLLRQTFSMHDSLRSTPWYPVHATAFLRFHFTLRLRVSAILVLGWQIRRSRVQGSGPPMDSRHLGEVQAYSSVWAHQPPTCKFYIPLLASIR
jgi:hypothetical protein